MRSCNDLAYSFHGGGLLVNSFSNYNFIRFPSPFLSFQRFWNRLNWQCNIIYTAYDADFQKISLPYFISFPMITSRYPPGYSDCLLLSFS
jgi:hypothetical protein